MQWENNAASVMASDQVSYALACAGRHIGPATTSISLAAQAVGHSLVNSLGQPSALTSPTLLPNVAGLELLLH